MDTIEFLGEENFLQICRNQNLSIQEIKTTREIIEKWDETMKIKDQEERMAKKIVIAAEKIADFSLEERGRILKALQAVTSLFVQLVRSRQ